MKNKIYTILVTLAVLITAVFFIRYFWWLILIVIGVIAWRYHKLKKSLLSAEDDLKALNEEGTYRQVFENGNHDIIEAEFTVHEEQGNTYDH